MTTTTIVSLTVTSAVCSGLSGGVYLAFAAMVMPVLRTGPADQAIGTMQRINVQAVRPPFMIVFFGGAAASAALGLVELASRPIDTPSIVRIIGSGLALTSFAITILRNVPLNNGLTAFRIPTPEGKAAWAKFDSSWSAANLIRGIAATASAIVLTVSLN